MPDSSPAGLPRASAVMNARVCDLLKVGRVVALVLYAYATKQRSSRAIECHCRQDIAFRVITGNLVPDHATVASVPDRKFVA